jgi:putative hemolysin
MRGTTDGKVEAIVQAGRQLRVRLADSADDIASAQRLRFEVFHNEMGARLPLALDQRDIDPFDALADHLLVEDLVSGTPRIVGTYRLLRQCVAERVGGFYSSGEYDLAPLIQHAAALGSNLLELGRSCVAPGYRDSGTIQLLWRGIASYMTDHRIGHLFGCASFPGTQVCDHVEALAYLCHHHLAPPQFRVRARDGDRVEMNCKAIGSYDVPLAMRALPPLIKAYLRVGAVVGDGAWIDREFNTIDVCVIMPVDAITARYSERFAAARIAA